MTMAGLGQISASPLTLRAIFSEANLTALFRSRWKNANIEWETSSTWIFKRAIKILPPSNHPSSSTYSPPFLRRARATKDPHKWGTFSYHVPRTTETSHVERRIRERKRIPHTEWEYTRRALQGTECSRERGAKEPIYFSVKVCNQEWTFFFFFLYGKLLAPLSTQTHIRGGQCPLGPIYITAHTGRAIRNLKPLLESGYLAGQSETPFRDGDKERERKTGPRNARVGGKGRREREREGVGLPTFASDWLPRNRRRPAASEGTGCACVAKGAASPGAGRPIITSEPWAARAWMWSGTRRPKRTR